MQELLGHADVSTTMIYTHMLNKGGRGVENPLERLERPRAGYGVDRPPSAHDARVPAI